MSGSRRPALHRTAAVYECQLCGCGFHPIYGTKRLYCSVQCSGKANSLRQESVRSARAAASVDAMSGDELLEWFKSLDTAPKQLDEDAGAEPVDWEGVDLDVDQDEVVRRVLAAEEEPLPTLDVGSTR